MRHWFADRPIDTSTDAPVSTSPTLEQQNLRALLAGYEDTTPLPFEVMNRPGLADMGDDELRSLYDRLTNDLDGWEPGDEVLPSLIESISALLNDPSGTTPPSWTIDGDEFFSSD